MKTCAIIEQLPLLETSFRFSGSERHLRLPRLSHNLLSKAICYGRERKLIATRFFARNRKPFRGIDESPAGQPLSQSMRQISAIPSVLNMRETVELRARPMSAQLQEHTQCTVVRFCDALWEELAKIIAKNRGGGMNYLFKRRALGRCVG